MGMWKLVTRLGAPAVVFHFIYYFFKFLHYFTPLPPQMFPLSTALLLALDLK